jgi:PPK2 family polyphosphate:nucleotide phosphotransferase
MALTQLLRANTKKLSLDDARAKSTPGGINEQAAIKATLKIAQKIRALQYQLYAENRQSLLIILQGLDASGKDGTIRHVLGMMNPQGCMVTGFKQPTPLESRHDFLWRIHPHAPGRGDVAIFNRSHYEDVLVARVHALCPKKQLTLRYDQINQFEDLLSTQNNTRIIKFFLHMSREEQLCRFASRLDDAAKHWKISMADYTERQYWDAYQDAYALTLKKTSTDKAPWFVVPSDFKWYRNFAVASIVLETLESMAPKLPSASVDLDQVRVAFHQAVMSETRRDSPLREALKPRKAKKQPAKKEGQAGLKYNKRS